LIRPCSLNTGVSQKPRNPHASEFRLGSIQQLVKLLFHLRLALGSLGGFLTFPLGFGLTFPLGFRADADALNRVSRRNSTGSLCGPT